MLRIEVEAPSPPHLSPTSSSYNALAALSRNASVISSSSSSSSSSSILPSPLRGPLRPLRAFSPPNRSRSRDPQSPTTPRATSRPPAYLARELGLSREENTSPLPSEPSGPLKTRSRQSSIGGAKFTANDFTFGEVLGDGSYSTVMQATYPPTQKVYAIKIVDKRHLMREGKVNTAHAEKNALTKLGLKPHPGIIRLHWTFQDEWSLYFVLELAPNGDLQTHIARLGSFNANCTRWYMAQVVDAVQWMHSKGVIHRDLKPENILLDSDMRVKITDFGTSKSFDEASPDSRATTWVGTAQYIAPELILHTYTCKSSDIWAVACMLFQCLAGRFPFVAATQYLMWEKVKKMEYDFPEHFDESAKDLVQKILLHDPNERLGAGPPDSPLSPLALRSHPFFSSIPWETLWTDPVPPLEVGSYQRPPSPVRPSGDNFDIGEEWEKLVSGGEGIPWDSTMPAEFVSSKRRSDEIAPHEIQRVESPDLEADQKAEVETLSAPSSPLSAKDSDGETAVGSKLDRKDRGSFSTAASGSTANSGSTSSSGGTRTGSVIDPATSDFLEQWKSFLPKSENVIFTSPVVPQESRTLRQRASSLIPSVSPKKIPPPSPKERQLVLTSNRILCLKLKSEKETTVKHEILFGGKRSSVEPKGDRQFAVHGSGKTFAYTVEDPALAFRWIQQIGEAMDAQRGRRATRL
ncbi:kinase-like protein [Sistotremastrum niveocremeum HHB9708]|uniref:non-specific serine/threonine protein kinase n=1 Tax=Sistotremastrum niveocremeum HHB9708 TaxID=1314777 RepID=A0A165A253_9AGAM|nr:kinase-like protein [Sistotremastrum niveocremeum HHB9708]